LLPVRGSTWYVSLLGGELITVFSFETSVKREAIGFNSDTQKCSLARSAVQRRCCCFTHEDRRMAPLRAIKLHFRKLNSNLWEVGQRSHFSSSVLARRHGRRNTTSRSMDRLRGRDTWGREDGAIQNDAALSVAVFRPIWDSNNQFNGTFLVIELFLGRVTSSDWTLTV
jgi:hypothetical protein